jgi:hypothetical protein
MVKSKVEHLAYMDETAKSISHGILFCAVNKLYPLFTAKKNTPGSSGEKPGVKTLVWDVQVYTVVLFFLYGLPICS